MTRKDLGVLAGPKGLNPLAEVGNRGVQLPPQAIVQGQTGPNLPAILGIKIERRAPYILGLRRTLAVSVGQAQKIVGEKIVEAHVIRATAIEADIAIDVVIEGLIKTLSSHVAAKL